MRKRLLAIVATVAMVVAMTPAMVFGATVTTEADLSAAFANGGEVTLGSDIAVSGTLTVPAGKTVTLDLNGNTISGVCNTGSGHLILVENTGTLNIKDSSSDGDGKITYAKGTSDVGWTIKLDGNLNLYSGTIELTGSPWSIGFAVDVRPNAWGTAYTEETTFTMYGGKVVSADAAIRVSSTSSTGYTNIKANFIMNGGEIDAVYDGIFIQQQGDGIVTAGGHDLNVTVNKGTISSDYAPVRIYGSDALNPVNMSVTGGDFDYTGTDSTGWIVEGFLKGTESVVDDAVIAISGGTFDGDVSEYLAAGLTQNANGKVIDPNAPVEDNNKPTDKPENSPNTGDNTVAPFAVAGLVMVAMAAAAVARRRYN